MTSRYNCEGAVWTEFRAVSNIECSFVSVKGGWGGLITKKQWEHEATSRTTGVESQPSGNRKVSQGGFKYTSWLKMSCSNQPHAQSGSHARYWKEEVGRRHLSICPACFLLHSLFYFESLQWCVSPVSCPHECLSPSWCVHQLVFVAVTLLFYGPAIRLLCSVCSLSLDFLLSLSVQLLLSALASAPVFCLDSVFLHAGLCASSSLCLFALGSILTEPLQPHISQSHCWEMRNTETSGLE